MNFLELAKMRSSVRKYQPKKVEEDKLLKILEAGRVAPTVVNTQPPRIIVIQEEEGFNKLTKGANIYGAPLAIIICAEQNVTWKRPFDGRDIADIDASIVTDHMMLQATELDLGTCWICHFNAEVIRNEFHLPNIVEPINILAIGYAATDQLSPNSYLESCITDSVF